LTKEPHISEKETRISAKEPYLHAGIDTYLLQKSQFVTIAPGRRVSEALFTKEPPISTKEPHISAKEPHISAKEPYLHAVTKTYLLEKSDIVTIWPGRRVPEAPLTKKHYSCQTGLIHAFTYTYLLKKSRNVCRFPQALLTIEPYISAI